MAYLLNVAYLLLIAAALPWLLYQRLRHGKYREGWDAKLWGRVPRRDANGRCLWLHAVSVGEVNLLAPIIERWERLHPDWEIVISSTTQAGFHLAQKRYAPRNVFYCPLDFSWAVRRAVANIQPTLLVLTELELWPNLIAAARSSGAKIAVVNGRLSEKSFRGYKLFQWLTRRVLAQIHLIAAQNGEYASRFLLLGAKSVSVQITGSIKFDGVRTSRGNADTARLKELAGIREDEVAFLAGSTQAPEESLAIDAFERLSNEHRQLRLILVPRHPERFDEVAATLDRRGMKWQRRSKLDAASVNATEGVPYGERILLVDVVGELGSWWGTAQIAFVGGSLTSRGGQNMIEPAAYGATVSFGPNTWNFKDVVSLLLARDAAVVVKDGRELEAFVRRCLSEPAWAESLGRRAQELVLEQQGAADRTIKLLSGLVQTPEAKPVARRRSA